MIDAHTHCFPDALAPRALSKTDLYGGVYETDATISGQIRLAEKEGLRKVVVLHVANRPDSMHHVNDFAVSVNGMAGKVISFASIHPHAPDAAEEVERLYSLGIRGIKFQPIRQGFFMDEPCCEPIFRKIGELGMMTVIHGGRSIRTKEFPVLPRTVARYIDCFQGAPVVLSHLGGMFLSEDEIRGLREGSTVKPFGNGEFLAVEGNGRIAVHIAVKSGEQRAAEGPRLTLIVSQIFDL